MRRRPWSHKKLRLDTDAGASASTGALTGAVHCDTRIVGPVMDRWTDTLAKATLCNSRERC